jgi:hypothetical protein
VAFVGEPKTKYIHTVVIKVLNSFIVRGMFVLEEFIIDLVLGYTQNTMLEKNRGNPKLTFRQSGEECFPVNAGRRKHKAPCGAFKATCAWFALKPPPFEE